MIANFVTWCDLCDHPIAPPQDVVKRHGKWVHSWCVPGGDDA